MIQAFRENISIYCVDHLLHNIVDKASNQIPEFNNLVIKCSALVRFFKKSGDITLKTTSKKCCPTRWNTLFYQFDSIKINWDQIVNILKEKGELYRIDGINLIEVEDITKILKVIENASKQLETTKIPSLHLVHPLLENLNTQFDILDNDSTIVKTVKNFLKSQLKILVFPNLSILHKIAIFLFPLRIN